MGKAIENLRAAQQLAMAVRPKVGGFPYLAEVLLIGEGIPLFGPLQCDLRLRHVAARAYPGGMVQSGYRVNPAELAP